MGSRSSSVSSNLSGTSIILKDTDSDAEMLEGIHTFNMKSQFQEEEKEVSAGGGRVPESPAKEGEGSSRKRQNQMSSGRRGS